MVGLNLTSINNFLINLLICMLVSMCGNSMALLVGSCVSNVKVASAISPVVFLPLILCSGFYANSDLLPVYIRWLNRIDPFTFAYNAVVHNEFDNQFNIYDPIALFNPTTQIWNSIYILASIAILTRFLALFALRISIQKLQA